MAVARVRIPHGSLISNIITYITVQRTQYTVVAIRTHFAHFMDDTVHCSHFSIITFFYNNRHPKRSCHAKSFVFYPRYLEIFLYTLLFVLWSTARENDAYHTPTNDYYILKQVFVLPLECPRFKTKFLISVMGSA